MPHAPRPHRVPPAYACRPRRPIVPALPAATFVPVRLRRVASVSSPRTPYFPSFPAVPLDLHSHRKPRRTAIMAPQRPLHPPWLYKPRHLRHLMFQSMRNPFPLLFSLLARRSSPRPSSSPTPFESPIFIFGEYFAKGTASRHVPDHPLPFPPINSIFPSP